MRFVERKNGKSRDLDALSFCLAKFSKIGTTRKSVKNRKIGVFGAIVRLPFHPNARMAFVDYPSAL